MTEYRLTALEPWTEPGADASEYVRFCMSEGERIGVAQGRVSRSAMASGSLRGIDWRTVLSVAVLCETESRLSAGLLSREAGADVTIELGSWDQDSLIKLANEPKHCRWQRPAEPRGSLCTATGSGPAEPTSMPLCASCDLPDSRLVCSGLIHPVVKYQDEVGVYAGDGGGVVADPRRFIETAFCNVRLRQQEWNECLPWSRMDCWHRVISDGMRQPKPDADAPARLIDEVPYLRLAYGERFRTKPAKFWPSIDERAVASILADCTSAVEFQQHITALDALITAMAPLPQLEAADQVNGEGNRLASIAALGKVLETRCGGSALPYVERLRALHRARNSFPAHARSDDLATALRALGVEHYPPVDWRFAWWQIAASLREALAAIRAAVQTSASDDGD